MFKGLNIESSAACNLKCTVCPTLSYGPDAVGRGYLRPETLKPVSERLAAMQPGSVDLTGWGEPLLNPRLPEIIRMARGATFTTNATLLDPRWAERIIKEGIGAVAVSIDAASRETYSKLHHGGDGGVVWSNVSRLRKRRDELKGKLPFISLHFLLMKTNLAEVADFVAKAADAGADEVVVKHVALFAKSSQYEEALFTGFFLDHTVDVDARKRSLDAAKEAASRAGIGYRRVGADDARKVPNCFGGALERPFIDHLGRVSPCCVLAHSVSRVSPDGKQTPGRDLFFGNIAEDDIGAIWEKPEYALHRKTISDGGTPDACRNCLGLWSVTVEPVT